MSARNERPEPDLEAAVGALLAGGRSRRMGRDKRALRFGGRDLADHAADALAATCTICVQLGGRAPGVRDWPVIPDRRPDSGPAAAIESGLLWFPGAALLVCALDSPFVTAPLLGQLLAMVRDGALAAAPHHGSRWYPLVAAYSPALLPWLQSRLDARERDLQGLLDDHGTALAETELARYGDPERMLLNVNTPADLERARGLL